MTEFQERNFEAGGTSIEIAISKNLPEIHLFRLKERIRLKFTQLHLKTEWLLSYFNIHRVTEMLKFKLQGIKIV
jgi:hypothetical protein